MAGPTKLRCQTMPARTYLPIWNAATGSNAPGRFLVQTKLGRKITPRRDGLLVSSCIHGQGVKIRQSIMQRVALVNVNKAFDVGLPATTDPAASIPTWVCQQRRIQLRPSRASEKAGEACNVSGARTVFVLRGHF